MNIAIFASAFYPHFGGVEEACRNLALVVATQGERTMDAGKLLPRRKTV